MKKDLRCSRSYNKSEVVTKSMGRDMAEKIRAIAYLECSAKRREGIKEVSNLLSCPSITHCSHMKYGLAFFSWTNDTCIYITNNSELNKQKYSQVIYKCMLISILFDHHIPAQGNHLPNPLSLLCTVTFLSWQNQGGGRVTMCAYQSILLFRGTKTFVEMHNLHSGIPYNKFISFSRQFNCKWIISHYTDGLIYQISINHSNISLLPVRFLKIINFLLLMFLFFNDVFFMGYRRK